jgi:hypothetical protein
MHLISRSGYSASWLLAAVGATLALPGRAAPLPLAADKVTGPETCVECHINEIEVWKRTIHNKTNRELPKKPETAEMLQKLGLTKVKGEAQCRDCHFLGREVEGQYETLAGIACESCHGAAADWVKTHGEYGQGFTAETEPPERRHARLAQAAAAGLRGPRQLYDLGASCYGCHILNEEQIVNTGGHVAGSPEFNLLTWSQGEVRHHIPRTGDKVNPPAPLARRRLLFVVGCILETEYSFRAVAQATTRAAFGLTQARRADAARKRLESIQAVAPTPELAEITAIAMATGLRLNNRTELVAAADKIAALGRSLAARATGDELAGVDPLLPGPEKFQGTPFDPLAAP